MAEAVGVLARKLRPIGTDQVAPNERRQPWRHLGLLRRERLHGASMEEFSLDRASLEHYPLRLVELVEPRCQQGLQRRRYLDLAVAFFAERDHLGQEERIASRRSNDPLSHPNRDAVANERACLVLRERI